MIGESASLSAPTGTADPVPLCVELDGTLLRTHLLVESLFFALTRTPWVWVRVWWWLIQGKACLKRQLAQRYVADPCRLPFNRPFLDYLQEQRKTGRPLILLTAADQHLAQRVTHSLHLFDRVVGSDGTTDRTGQAKLAWLRAEFGEHPFDYAGNSRDDWPVFRQARQCILVTPQWGMPQRADKAGLAYRLFADSVPFTGTLARALRLSHWSKNILVFLPLLFAHRHTDWPLLLQAFALFMAFNLLASSVYLLNDLLDLEADRAHPSKQHRPFAHGLPNVTDWLWGIPALILGACLICLTLNWATFYWLLGYCLMTLAYSCAIKSRMVIDVLFLSFLYILRLLAGGAATGVHPSPWLLAFSLFFFLSVALVKRYVETDQAGRRGLQSVPGRGYTVQDLEMIALFGVTSAMNAVVILALYANSPQVSTLYSRPEMIGGFCLLLLCWLGRIWFRAHRGDLGEDPVGFIFLERGSQYLILTGSILFFLAV